MPAEGPLAAGGRLFVGHPITPASEIYEIMMRELPARGGLVLSAPDDISSLCYSVSVSLRGLEAMTATSGPGRALMIETVQYAFVAEASLEPAQRRAESAAVLEIGSRLGLSSAGPASRGQLA